MWVFTAARITHRLKSRVCSEEEEEKQQEQGNAGTSGLSTTAAPAVSTSLSLKVSAAPHVSHMHDIPVACACRFELDRRTVAVNSHAACVVRQGL